MAEGPPTTEDMWDIVIDVHLRGTYLCAKAAFDHMVERGEGGRIIVTSSTSGLLGNFGQTNYGAAKAGIAGFARCLWLEGVKVNGEGQIELRGITLDAKLVPIYVQHLEKRRDLSRTTFETLSMKRLDPDKPQIQFVLRNHKEAIAWR